MAKNYFLASVWLTGLLGYATAQASCGSTACPINTNWDEHSPSRPGWSADLRYSFSRADQLRSGSGKIAADTTADEVENLSTLNKIVTAELDYTHDEHWSVMLHLPYIMRDHDHNLGPYDGPTPAGYENFSAKALGDIKVMGRYRWALDESSRSGMGVKFGLKLNTGKKDFAITQTGGKPGEATLQPGNDSTDLIVGAFMYKSAPGSNWICFAQGAVQSSINSNAAFRPGNQINLDAGSRYAFSRDLSGLLQFGVQWNGKDSGESAALTPAGEASSGGRVFSITPGLSYAITPSTQLYGLVQLPLYQYMNGEQLTANSSFTVGVSHRF